MIKSLQDIAKIDCEIFSADDWANGRELRAIIEKFDEIKAYLNSYNFAAPYTADTLTDYFIVTKICAWNFIDRVNENYKDKYLEIKDFFEKISLKYERKKIVEFLKSFSFKFDDTNKFGFTFRLYDTLPQFVKDIKDECVWSRAINAHPYLILNKFADYQKVFMRYVNLYAALFSDAHIESFMEGAFEEFAKISVNVCLNKDFIDQSLKDKLKSEFSHLADKIINNTDLNLALQNQIKYKIILEFLRATSCPNYAEYLEKKKIVDELSEKWLEQNGQEFSFEIPLDKAKKWFDNDSIPYWRKYLELTHSKSPKQWNHFVVGAMKNGRKSLINFLTCTNIDENSNFSAMVQENLDFEHGLRGLLLRYFVHEDDKWRAFVQNTFNFINYIYTCNGLSSVGLEGEIVAWANKGKEYFFENSVPNDEQKDISITFTDKTIKLTEKLLRDIYSAEMKKERKYFDPEKLVLGSILNYNDPSNPMTKLLSVELMQYLSYCLIKDKDENGRGVGIALRNLFEHNRYDWDEFNDGYVILAILVLVSILNGLFISYMTKKI